MLAQVERVEMPALLDEEIRQVGLEEIVDESVYVEHGPIAVPVRPAPDQGGRDRPFLVPAEVDHLPFVRRPEQVRFPSADATPRYQIDP